MELIANLLLAAGAIGAAVYCLVLSRRLSAFNQLEDGMGGAIAVLSAQVDDMTTALQKAQSTSLDAREALHDMTARAEAATAKLELMLASLHDLPDQEDGAARTVTVHRTRRAGPSDGDLR